VIKIVLWLCLACNPCQLRVSGVSEPCFVSQPALELSRSMLDTEINIQKGLNEVGCIASKEALKYFYL
jgi:hypothetical protein